jgi:hypothetical protein
MWLIVSIAVIRNNIKSRERYLWNVLAGIGGIVLTYWADSWAYNVLDRNPDLDDDFTSDGITDVDNSELAQSEESVKDKERGGGSRAEGGAGRLSSGQCVVVEVVVEQSLV